VFYLKSVTNNSAQWIENQGLKKTQK